MTVLHLVNTMEWGGVRKHVLDLAEGVEAQGLRSLIAAWIPPNDELHDDPRVTHLPLYSGWNSVKSPTGLLSSVRILRRLLTEEGVNVLHMHSRYATLLGSMAARGRRIRRVYTAHNTFEDMRWLRWYPKHIIAPAEAVRQHLLRTSHNFGNHFITVIPHGVAIPELPLPGVRSEARFCFAGRLREEKGIRILYEALLLLRKDGGVFPEVDIIGDGPLLDWLKERITADFQGSSITLHGFHPAPMDLISASTALLFPSLGLDSAPYVTLEAMATGVPVIASDLEVLKGLVVSQETGMMFPTGDAAALAAALRYAILHQDEMHALGLRGREFVRKQHDLTGMCAATAAFYRDIQEE